MSTKWYPVTPAGTVIVWLASDTADEAWQKLLEDASHMPYKGKEEFRRRGYRVGEYAASMAQKAPPAHLYKSQFKG